MNGETFAQALLMVRPAAFGFNDQTAGSNAFQSRKTEKKDLQEQALNEFDGFTAILKANQLDLIILNDTPEPHTPDSVFPNNWFSTHRDGTVFLFPMAAENRRLERRDDLAEVLSEGFRIKEISDLSYLEKEGKYLEGTGSMVLDRLNRVAYACLSARTHPDALKVFSDQSGYRIVSFHAFGLQGEPVYHTNVMMCIARRFAVVCLEAVTSGKERELLKDTLSEFNKELIEITTEQMARFAGNMLQVQNKAGEDLLIMSDQAFISLREDQIKRMERSCRLIHAPLYTIEAAGGGSARCMLAEICLPAR